MSEQIADLRARLEAYAIRLSERTDELEQAQAAAEEAEANAAQFRADARRAQDRLRRAEEQQGGAASRLEERLEQSEALVGPLRAQLGEARQLHEQERAEWAEKEATLRHRAKNAQAYLDQLRTTREELVTTQKKLEKASTTREELDKLRRKVRGQAARIKQLKASGATEPDPLDDKLRPAGYRAPPPPSAAERKMAALFVSATRLVDVLPDGAEVDVLSKRCAQAERQLSETRERLVQAEDTGGKERARRLARTARGLLDSMKPSVGLETEMRDSEGIVVTHVRRAGSAERAGIVRGMTVLRVADAPAEHANAVAVAAERLSPGEELEIVVADGAAGADGDAAGAAGPGEGPAAGAGAGAGGAGGPTPPGGAGATDDLADADEDMLLSELQLEGADGEDDAESFLVDVDSPDHRAVTLVVGAKGVDLKTVQRLAALANGVLAADEGEEAFVESVIARRLAKASTAEAAAKQVAEARARAAAAIPPEVVDALREQISQIKDASAREAKLLREGLAAREEELEQARAAAAEDAAAAEEAAAVAAAAAAASLAEAREQAVSDTASYRQEAEDRAAEAEQERTLRDVLRREKDRLAEELLEARARIEELEPLVARVAAAEKRVAELTKTEAGLRAAIQRVAELEQELESHRKRVREQRRMIEEKEREEERRAAEERAAEEARLAAEAEAAAEAERLEGEKRAAAAKRRMSLKALQLLGVGPLTVQASMRTQQGLQRSATEPELAAAHARRRSRGPAPDLPPRDSVMAVPDEEDV